MFIIIFDLEILENVIFGCFKIIKFVKITINVSLSKIHYSIQYLITYFKFQFL